MGTNTNIIATLTQIYGSILSHLLRLLCSIKNNLFFHVGTTQTHTHTPVTVQQLLLAGHMIDGFIQKPAATEEGEINKQKNSGSQLMVIHTDENSTQPL